MLSNFKILLSSPKRILAYFVLVIIFSLVWWYATDIRIMFGNYGNIHTYTDIGLSIFIIILFPLLIISIFYKSWTYGKRADIELNTINGAISGIIGTIISGASCCGATLATYFGLLPLMSFLPYDGLELKILGTIGLAYGLWSSINHLTVCKTKK
ncbi:hypothetical protein K2X92_00125 [Candidatus Gracilibacteria bacterium]|nr:hypothetical protein [Candidatus Gracilibacteria bacterium]